MLASYNVAQTSLSFGVDEFVGYVSSFSFHDSFEALTATALSCAPKKRGRKKKVVENLPQ